MKKLLLSLLLVFSLFVAPLTSFAAIAFDSAGGENKVDSGLTISYSQTVGSGSDRILFSCVTDQSGISTNVSGITFNSVAFTKIAERNNGALDGVTSLWYLVNPASGSHTLEATRTLDVNGIMMVSSSYTGAAQSSQPDASATAVPTTDPFGVSVTSIADNSWAVLCAYVRDKTPIAAGSSTTQRSTNGAGGTASGQSGIFDGNAAVTPAGSVTLNVNPTGSSVNGFSAVMATFAPSVAVSITPASILSLVRSFWFF